MEPIGTDIILRAAGGDHHSLSTVFDFFYHDLIKFVRKVFKKIDPEDIVHESFIKFFNLCQNPIMSNHLVTELSNVEKESPQKRLKAYLLTMCFHLAIDLIRKEKAYRIFLTKAALNGQVMNESNFSDFYLDEYSDIILTTYRHALNTVPDLQRIIFEYRTYDALNYKQIQVKIKNESGKDFRVPNLRKICNRAVKRIKREFITTIEKHIVESNLEHKILLRESLINTLDVIKGQSFAQERR